MDVTAKSWCGTVGGQILFPVAQDVNAGVLVDFAPSNSYLYFPKYYHYYYSFLCLYTVWRTYFVLISSLKAFFETTVITEMNKKVKTEQGINSQGPTIN